MPALPLATQTLTVQRRTQSGDPYEAPGAAVTVASVRGVVYTPNGAEASVGGAQEVTDARAVLPAGTDVTHLDWITDGADGSVWSVVWVARRVGLGLDHVVAGVNRVAGAAAGAA